MTILSILVCSLPNRLQDFTVIQELTRQAEKFPNVQILYLGDNKSMTVGEKRNKLMELASGEYICFVDDDDRVEPDYVNDIVVAINAPDNKPEVVTFLASVKLNDGPAKICHYQVGLQENYNTPDAYFRQPNHLMVWKKSILVNFLEINCGEDNDFGVKMNNILLKQRLSNNVHHTEIQKVLYHYDFNSKKTEAQKR